MEENSTAAKMLNSNFQAMIGNQMNQSKDLIVKAKTQTSMKVIIVSVQKFIAKLKEYKVKLYDLLLYSERN